MEKKYDELIEAFKELDIDDKKEEIFNVVSEEFKLLYLENKKYDSFNTPLNVLNEDNDDDDSYYDLLFTYIMALRNECDKLIMKVEE